jgi:phage major capsid protein, HK97 family|uniref:Major capsid protein n=2 Tax=unclassified Caudoviricetes TaxID=2788787 RepID=A0A8S5NA52_9CAUD|nr:MAG TPA: major capsid protein [Siphoviridae sp. ctkBO7]DAD91122.1 MAG TPA: major capsid protein [Siphoviridae sp. ctuaf34]
MNFKKLIEKRNDLVAQMDELVKLADTETRALNEDETKKFEELRAEVANIDKTLELAKEERSMMNTPEDKKTEVTGKAKEQAEERAFANFLRTGATSFNDVETRSDVNLGKGDNGVVVPATIAARIIKTVKNIAPIIQNSDFYDVKGDLVFVVDDESTTKTTCNYVAEFQELESTSGKFKAVTLKGNIAGVLVKVSKSLINNAGFDIVNYVVTKVADSIAQFLEGEMINGTTKIEGLLNGKQVVTAAGATAVTADDLIDLQLKVPQQYRGNGCFIMNPKTFAACAKLKDGQGQYLLNKDITGAFGYTLLGRPVFESDNMPEVATKKAAVVFADLMGYATKISGDSAEITILQERFATQYAVGVAGYVEVDGKIVDQQRIAVLKMA